jgi:hypothetical protein
MNNSIVNKHNRRDRARRKKVIYDDTFVSSREESKVFVFLNEDFGNLKTTGKCTDPHESMAESNTGWTQLQLHEITSFQLNLGSWFTMDGSWDIIKLRLYQSYDRSHTAIRPNCYPSKLYPSKLQPSISHFSRRRSGIKEPYNEKLS